MPVDIFQSLWQEFAVESGEQMEALEPLLVAAETAPGDVTPATIATLFRGMHSIKGMAAALALQGMERVSHHTEHLLGEVRAGNCTLDAALAALLLEALDELKRLRVVAIEKRADTPVSQTVMTKLEQARIAIERQPKPDDCEFASFETAVRSALSGPLPLHPDPAMLSGYIAAVHPQLPLLARMVGPELESTTVRSEVRKALEVVRVGAERLGFTQVVRTAELLTALIPLEGCLDYYAREQAIDALSGLRREIATVEIATGGDGGGEALDQALNNALALDFSARRRSLFDVLGRFEREPGAFAPGGSAVVRAAELAGDIYNHFSFLYNAKAGRLLLMIEDTLSHAARGDLLVSAELLGLIRQTLTSLTPAPGKPMRDVDAEAAALASAALEKAVHLAVAAVEAAGPGAVPGYDETVVAGRQFLTTIGVTPELLDRLSGPRLYEVAEQVAGHEVRLWEIDAELERAEDKAEQFAGWLESHARALTSRALPGTTALSFQFLVLTAEDDATVEAALAEIDPGGTMLKARRCGAPLVRATPVPTPAPAPAAALICPQEPALTSTAATTATTTATPSTPSAAPSAAIGASAATGNVLRVPGEVVDQFLAVIGEMVTASGMLDEAVWGDNRRSRLPLDLKRLMVDMRADGGSNPAHLEALQRYAAGQQARDRALRQARDRMTATLGRLQESALELRVVPVEAVFGRLPRLVRDLAASHGKQVRVEIDGRGVRVDKGMVDHLLDPLIHMVRNAIDHGIETPDVRMATGKPPVATLSIRADQRENRVVIEVSDDGRGLDAEVIRQRAVERQLVGEANSRLLRESDLFRLILLPGFSTTDQVTETSGRGVGMDVVHTGVTRLGGAIEIRSRPGHGATFTLRLPLSAAIQDVLLVEADSRLHAIPVRHLLELCSARPGEIQEVHGRSVMLLHGTLLPIFRLTGLLGGDGGSVGGDCGLPEAGLPIVVLGDGRRRLGLQVDRVVRRQELFVRDIHPRIAAIPGLGGAALLGDGKVVLIIDCADLFQLAMSRSPVPVPVPATLSAAPAGGGGA